MQSIVDRVVLVCSVLLLGLYVVAVASKRARLGALGLLEAVLACPLGCRRRARDTEQSSREAFVAKLMDKKRGEMITVASSVSQCMLCVAILCGVVNIVGGSIRIRNSRQDVILLVVFGFQVLATCNHDFGSGRVNSLFVYAVSMFGWTAFVVTTTDSIALIAVNAFMLFPRVVFSLAYMKSGTVCLLNVLHSAASSLTYSYMVAETHYASTSPGTSQCDVIANMSQFAFSCTDLLCCSIVVLCALGWERTMTSHARNELEVTATRGETTATRRLLNTICDAIFELDDDLRIADDALQLASALQHGCDRSLRGMQAENLLVIDDRALFRERVTAPVLASQSMANVLHVRMRDSLNNILKVELFHVPVAGSLTGASHLIGVREHADYGEHPFQKLPGRLAKGVRGRGEAPLPSAPPRGPAPPATRLGTPAVAVCESIGSSSEALATRRTGNSSSSSSETQPASLERSFLQPLFVRFDAISFTVAESSGTYSELFRPGTSFTRSVPAQQQFFVDLSAGVTSLNCTLPCVPSATFRFQSTLAFDHEGAVLEGSCVVILARGEADEDGPSLDTSCRRPVEASLQVAKATRTVRPRNGSVSSEQNNIVDSVGNDHMSDSRYLDLLMQDLPDGVSNSCQNASCRPRATDNDTALVL